MATEQANSVAQTTEEQPQQLQQQSSESRPAGRFKIASKVIMAMRRFQASLNPTYEYGKRASNSDPVEHVGPNSVHVQSSSNGRPTSGRTTSGRTSSGRPTSGHHGHKGGLLFRPLPKLEQEVIN